MEPQVMKFIRLPEDQHRIAKEYSKKRGMKLQSAIERIFRRGLKEMGLLTEDKEVKP